MKATYTWVKGEDLVDPTHWSCYVTLFDGEDNDNEPDPSMEYLSVIPNGDGSFKASVGNCGMYGGEVASFVTYDEDEARKVAERLFEEHLWTDITESESLVEEYL